MTDADAMEGRMMSRLNEGARTDDRRTFEELQHGGAWILPWSVATRGDLASN